MDEPNLQLLKYVSADRSSINYSRANDRVLDDLYDKQIRASSTQERYKLLREFEKRALDQSYTFPTLWWHRSIVTWKKLQGWAMSPSHYLHQDLAGAWLDQ